MQYWPLSSSLLLIEKKKISHILLSSCQNVLLSSACNILNFLHPHPPYWIPQLFQILSEMSSKNFEMCGEVSSLSLTPGASGTNPGISIWCHVSVTRYLQGQFKRRCL